MTRYLTERLERIQAEKDLANHMGRRYKEALEASKRILSSKETNREYLHNLLKTVTFPVAQPGIDNKSFGQHSSQYILKCVFQLISKVAVAFQTSVCPFWRPYLTDRFK